MKKLTVLAVLLTVTFAAMAQEAPKKYGIKSGIARTVTEVMGQKMEAMEAWWVIMAQKLMRLLEVMS